ncbi:Putative Arf GTPase activating protein [Septoria linicola]|uniref:ADP-ribosylation factor GTPase-activating protein n=1 Tax=Septoria linicola TaxID=215465 RepID=A0A9Q9EQK1_9PEZI|nr:putative Arf GTPase activating protein [Septoria linicola]USW57633.1 Putative Arf GTPase activating protein [Septoria linicola]
MGNISSKTEDGASVCLSDQARFSIASINVTNSRGQTLLRVSPNAYPATRFSAQKDAGDDSPIEYVQDSESLLGGVPPSFLVRLTNIDDLNFHFTFIIRQQGQSGATASGTSNSISPTTTTTDTSISGLTYVFASTPREVEHLVVREFHTDPNLHKNPNVQLLGDYATAGNPSAQFSWTWKWRPPKTSEDRGGGWRNTCSFVEYNQRTHKLETLASFSFWVQNTQRFLSAAPRSPMLEVNQPQMPTRLRVPSTQSIESRISNVSDSEGEGSYQDYKDVPQSPTFEPIPENGLGLLPTLTAQSLAGLVKVDVATCKPGEDPSLNEDGPLFRATMRSLEQKTGNMRQRMKKVLKTAEAAESAQQACNQAVADFTNALRDAATSNANAVQPALDHYFEKIAKEILHYEKQNTVNLQKLIIEPISKLYNFEIKQADSKKREFDEESKEYYAFVGKYLGQRTESLKEKKVVRSDEKYQAKRRTFELKRFDYSSFMHDLHGGRKDQEVLSHLTRYADAQARSYLTTAKKVEDMVPQLDALVAEVKLADQDFKLLRQEREEKRRALETSTKLMNEDGNVAPTGGLSHSTSVRDSLRPGDALPTRSTSLSGNAILSQSPPSASGFPAQPATNGLLNTPANPVSASATSPASKFKGIRDLEDNSSAILSNSAMRKEGLLWALSRPGLHVDPKGITKPGWHKFWIVLDQGKLSEYVNWKDKLDLHMDPIDLRMASVREARNADRRFCFEVITPQFTRVYQAPSEDDLRAWIGAINNALQSAFENKNQPLPASPSPAPTSHRKDIAAVLTGKSSSFSGHRQVSNPNRHSASSAVSRHATTGDKPAYKRIDSEPEPSALLQRIKNADEGNKVCADCGSDSKVDWCSINLGVLLCIECSGIHRSLGTHISKVRGLTLDTSFATQDIIEVLLLIGNRVSNMIWEAKLDRFLKPSPHSTRDQRLHFITAKYSDRTYVQPSAAPISPDDYLLTSIKKNDIQSVLHALALRANPNAHDRVRATHAVYLALAAADPAAPASGYGHSSSPSIRAASGSSISAPPRPSSPLPRKPFPLAELILQNGADIPSEPSPFPLSDHAKMYLELKREQRMGKTESSAGMEANGDNLTPLPNSALGTSPGSLSRDRERLLHRNSSGRPKSRASLATDAIEGFVKK